MHGAARPRAHGASGGSVEEGTDLAHLDELEASKRQRRNSKQRRQQTVAMAVIIGGMMLMCGAVLAPAFSQHGARLASEEHGVREAPISDANVDAALANHTFLFIGGSHRGGTTVLWEVLSESRSLGGFEYGLEEVSRSGVGGNGAVPVRMQKREGIFLQDVYPIFGIASEQTQPASQRGRAEASPEGIGGFGFDPAAHLTEESPLITPHNQRRLFRQWARFWDLRLPALVEKSPPNLITSRYLQANFPSSKFLFIRRHPIAVALATQKWKCCWHLSVAQLVAHWVRCHTLQREDAAHLKHSKVLIYEDFVTRPQEVAEEVWSWLGLKSSGKLRTTVRTDTNAKYEAAYAAWRRESAENEAAHAEMVAQHGAAVRSFGYGLSGAWGNIAGDGGGESEQGEGEGEGEEK